MYKKPSVDDEGDYVGCTRCTCPPAKKKDRKAAIPVKCISGQNSLIHYGRWMDRRKQIQKYLTKSLNCSAGDLLMNLSGDTRRIQEERLHFEYCRIDTYFDKIRGSPLFWKMPAGLHDPCDPRNPVYLSTMSKLERHEIPSIEYITTPSHLMNEKDVLPCNRKLFTAACRHDKNCKPNESSSTINKYQFHKPECEDIIAIGKKLHVINEIQEGKSEQSQFKTISLKDEVVDVSSEQSVNIFKNPNVSFSINETLISSYNDFRSAVVKMRILFECLIPMKESKIKYVKFKNLGLAAVRFHWNRVDKFLLFSDIIMCERENTHPFHFNKNVLLLPPGDTMYFPIWFKAKCIGNYLELWEMTTEPQMWDSDYHLILTLQGFVYPLGFIEKAGSIKMMLEKRVLNSVIHGLMNDILQQLKFAESEHQTLMFTEKQLFESANNISFGFERRPKYMYKKDVVAQLKSLYAVAKFPDSPKTWNYSIKDLRMVVRRRDIWVYVENQTKEMLKGKQRRIELSSSTGGQTDPYVPIVVKPEVEISKEPCSRRLDIILQELECPSMVPNLERSKYFLTFSVLRTFSFKIGEVLDAFSEYADEECFPCYNYKCVKSVEQLPDRLIFERFDDIWIDRAKKDSRQNVMDLSALPKPEFLRDIPTSNFKLVYKLYFRVADVTVKNDTKENKDKNDKGSKSVKTKTSKSSGKGGKMMQVSSPLVSMKENFDPFVEEYIPLGSPKVSDTIISNNTCSTASPSLSRSVCYQHHRHLMISSLLMEAVKAIVDVLETFKENVVCPEVLGEIKKCTDIVVEGDAIPDVDVSLELNQTHAEDTETKEPKLEDNPYFQNLIDSHLNKNLYTKDYIIEGKRKISREEGTQNILATSGSSKSCIFKSCDTISEESVRFTSSVGIQTNKEANIDVEKELANTIMPYNVETSNSSSACDESLHSNDIFYYMEEGSESK